ncbi:MAG: AraC family ligand binding domain-containing protein, partial [Lachnospiraceae bacterium]|nr:AraC family ligand binding domain-containing protein [Lachnospiraceae bacterium]
MRELNSCKDAMQICIENKYFAVAHLYKDEKVMAMHIHDCYELYFSISGGKQFLIDNKLYPIEPGDIFMINQYESHYVSQIDQTPHERIVIMIHPDFIKSMSSARTNLNYCFEHSQHDLSHRLHLTPDQQKRFLYYINRLLSATGYGADLEERAVFTELFLMLNSLCLDQEDQTPADADSSYHSQVDEILSYINN